LLEIVKNKTTLASWLVSNCDGTKSNRTALVRKLQALGVDVQIFGGCGNNSLSYYDRTTEAVKAKFYLAFENSLCVDYATEKVFKFHKYDIVPVVFSGGKLIL
jgi:alpha-1,3-fucosyltransferase